MKTRTSSDIEERVRLLERTIKRAMAKLPAGEHFHVASIILEQNAEIVQLKKLVKRIAANAPHQARAIASRPECGCSQEASCKP